MSNKLPKGYRIVEIEYESGRKAYAPQSHHWLRGWQSYHRVILGRVTGIEFECNTIRDAMNTIAEHQNHSQSKRRVCCD